MRIDLAVNLIGFLLLAFVLYDVRWPRFFLVLAIIAVMLIVSFYVGRNLGD